MGASDQILLARAQSDLQWLKNCPPLHNCGEPPSEIRSLLPVPGSLSPVLRSALLSTMPLRLGRYAELLFQWSLEANPKVEHLICGLVVREQRRTIGEFDFLIKQRGKAGYLHLELSVKFYLGQPPLEQPSDWVGTNPRDNLGRKIERMGSHQYRLGDNPAAASTLTEHGVSLNRRAALMLGIVFQPYSPLKNPPPPPAFATDARTGWWCRIEEVDELPGGPTIRYRSLTRLEWLSGESFVGAPRLYQSQELKEFCATRPQMLQRVEQWGDKWVIHERGVVVPDCWPHCPPRKRSATAEGV